MDDLKCRKVIVYGLITDLDDNIRYVGQTKQPIKKRIQQHINEKRGLSNRKARWLHNRLGQGLDLRVILLDEDAIWDDTEVEWIKRLKDGGCDLTNATDGGEGNCNVKFSPEAIRNMSYKYTLKDGREFTLKELSKKFDLNTEAIRGRLRNGYTVDEAVSDIEDNFNRIIYKSVSYTLKEAANEFNINLTTIESRYYAGWCHDRIIEGKLQLKGKRYKISSGEELTIQEISEMTDICHSTIKSRIQRGWSLTKITEPMRVSSTVSIDGVDMTIKDIEKLTGIPERTLRYRVSKNLCLEDIIRPLDYKVESV